MRKLAALFIAVAGAASMLPTPADACPAAACPAPATIDRAAATAPRWPIPGFDQMLTAREPAQRAAQRAVLPAAQPAAQPDVLLPFFQATLWSAPARERFARAAQLESVGVAK